MFVLFYYCRLGLFRVMVFGNLFNSVGCYGSLLFLCCFMMLFGVMISGCLCIVLCSWFDVACLRC